jgi:uncharacterized membrane protein
MDQGSQFPVALHEHIMSQSPAKVGICLTLLGLLRVVEGVTKVTHLTDEMLAVTAIGFLSAGLSSYFAVKERDPKRKNRLDILSHRIFVLSIGALGAICAIVAFHLF